MNSNKINSVKNNPAFALNIIEMIENEIGREVTTIEENLVISAIKNMPISYFKQRTMENIITLIKDTVIDEIAIVHCDINDVDTHEMLKNTIDPNKKDNDNMKKEKKKDHIVEINVDSIFGYDDIATLVKKVNEPINSVNTIYLLLDTRHRNLENDGTKYFKWDYINKMAISQGTVNSLGDIRDIISMNVMPYRIPAVPSAINDYNLITMSIEEFSPQAVIAHEDRRFHFIGCIDEKVDDWLIICSKDYNNAEYKFNKPITTLNTITTRFGSPLTPITFNKDRLPGTITYGNPTIFSFDEEHKLNAVTPSTVYVSSFTTLNTRYDSDIMGQMTNISGILGTVLTPSSISVPVDTSDIVTALTGTVAVPSVNLVGTILATTNSNSIIGTGTSFNTDFNINDYVQIKNNTNNPIFQIKNILSDTQITLKEKYVSGTGSYGYRFTGLTINGTGTLFTTELNINDNVIINDGGTSPNYIIKTILSDELLLLETPYDGLNGAGFVISKDNSTTNVWDVYFGSKRMFMMLQLSYLSS
jgi:hypothetical protein